MNLIGYKREFLGALIMAVVAFVGCSKKNDHKHAPNCPYGQVLFYDDTGYSCRYVNMYGSYGQQPYGGYQQPYGGYQQPYGYPQQNGAYQGQAAQGVTPPVANCQIPNQTLINWKGTWLCYTNDVLFPSNGDSPTGTTPPAGRGGEFCTSVGYGGYQSYGGDQQPYGGYQQPYGGYQQPYGGYGSGAVVCSPGFTCQPAAQPAATTDPYNSYNPYGGYQQPYGGYGMGQSGTCVYQGYRGY
ncbi:MAG: hypothetical protein IT289_04565 [Oligoflexia bacterium]|nr:hypothetical protein [Oligoflexia bacterium]